MSVSDEIETQDGVFASVTDLMVGLLFVFLILLVFFAIQYRTAAGALTHSESDRAAVLTRIAAELRDQNVRAVADGDVGVLRLPQDALFAKGSAELTGEGVHAVDALAHTLNAVLGCELGRATCVGRSRVETVLIEGHTDKDPLEPGARFADNWELSTARALATYHEVLAAEPALKGRRALFGIAGYGPDRPIVLGDGEAEKAKNRRIDVRLVMSPPKPN